MVMAVRAVRVIRRNGWFVLVRMFVLPFPPEAVRVTGSFT